MYSSVVFDNSLVGSPRQIQLAFSIIRYLLANGSKAKPEAKHGLTPAETEAAE